MSTRSGEGEGREEGEGTRGGRRKADDCLRSDCTACRSGRSAERDAVRAYHGREGSRT